MKTEKKLRFSKANTKLRKLIKVESLKKYLVDEKTGKNRKIYSLDLLAGQTCPYAKECKSWVYTDKTTGKQSIKDGKDCRFRCYAVSLERYLPNVYELHKHNTDVLKKCRSPKQFADVISKNLPKNTGIVRIHSSGDFFNRNYFLGWLRVAESNPDKLFYCYTKCLKYLESIDMLEPENGKIRENFLVTASRGGKQDDKIEGLGLRSVSVIYSEGEAILPIDNDDSHAASPCGSFSILIHGTQPVGSEPGKAVYKIRKNI